MKNFVHKLFFLSISLVLNIGCISTCTKSTKKIEVKIDIIKKINNRVSKELKGEYFSLNLFALKKHIDTKEYQVLQEMGFESLSKINDAFVFSFKTSYKMNWLEKTVDANFKYCNVHLIYSNNKETKEKVIYYEQFTECRTKLKYLDDNWVLIVQFFDCN